MKTANYNDYGYNLARVFSRFLPREEEVKASRRNLMTSNQVMYSTDTTQRSD